MLSCDATVARSFYAFAKPFNSFQLKYLSRIEFFNTFKRDIEIFIYRKNIAMDLHLLLKKKKTVSTLCTADIIFYIYTWINILPLLNYY